MHKYVLGMFGFFKSFLQFLKIIIVFFILLHLLFWIENLTGNEMGFLNFFRPVLASFVDAGGVFSNNSLDFFGAKFEFKYFIALLLYLILYLVDHCLYKLLNFVQEVYISGYTEVKKIEEKAFNEQLAKTQTNEQARLRRYNIYVSTSVKPKFNNRGINVDLDEQNKIMNKFLIEKLGISPTKYEGGFLYSFGNFATIDSVLEVFFKLLHSTAPIDYIICVQVLGNDLVKENEQLRELIDLKFINKISTCSDTAYRYGFNAIQKFETSQIGLFQKSGDTFEVHEFRELD